MASTLSFTQPAVFIPHGGGPMPLLNEWSHRAMLRFMSQFQKQYVKHKPDAIVVVTAHWEADVTMISSVESPELYYDYGHGWPDGAYDVKYPAPGSPALAKRVQSLLMGQGIPAKLDTSRGNDHGVFVPMKLMFPDADIPVVQMSIYESLDPATHIALGEALRSLRRDNIMLVGSGFSFHSFEYFFGDRYIGNHMSVPFHEYLTSALVETTDPDERRRRLERWEHDAPYAREVQPREEHLMPLLVIAGAGLDEPCQEIFTGKIMEIRTAGFLFGSVE